MDKGGFCRALAATAVCCMLAMGGCAGTTEMMLPDLMNTTEVVQPTPTPAPVLDRMRVAVLQGDTMNPYTYSTGTNGDLMPLLYDPLVKLDEHFKPQPCLAAEVTMAGAVCTVRLRDGVLFSDGRPLTAQDVVYSLGCCIQRDSARRYANVQSYRAVDDRTLEIVLFRPDIWFENLLTFLIIPQDSVDQPSPAGTGRYVLAEPGMMKKNNMHFDGTARVTHIELVAVKDTKEIGYELLSGGVDYALLPSDSSRVETAGGFLVQSNDMMFLGFNALIFPTDSMVMRQAIAKLVDRTQLVSESCRGRAVAAPYPVNPLFYPDESGTAGVPDVEGANALLDGMGLTELDAQGYRARYGQAIALQLAINVESADKRAAAALLKSQLEKGKLKLVINEYGYDQYKAQVLSGGYSLYLGETRLSEDMDLSPLLDNQGGLHYFLGDTSQTYAAYLAARQGETDYGTFLSAFGAEMPFVPLLFQQSMISHSRNFYSAVVATQQDIFYNIHQW